MSAAAPTETAGVDRPRVELPALPALIVGKVHHTRHRPITHAFTYGSYQWLIDLDKPPRLPRPLRPLATFRGEDHLAGAPGLAALKANAIRVLGRSLDASPVTKVLMLANARVAGHVFNPMSLFWCLDADNGLVGVVIEVHNTYGGRHAYVVSGAEAADTSIHKDFYVSPFNETSGVYDVRLRLSARRLAASITLVTGGKKLLTAAITGRTEPVTGGRLLRQVAANGLITYKVSALIRLHGIWLWLRRLPVQPRPDNDLRSVQ